MARTSAAVVLGTVAVMALSACGGEAKGSNGAAGEVPESIVMDLRNDIDTFDPAISSSDQGSMQLFEALYDTPVRQDHETGGVSPAMATTWDVTPTKIVFTLRPDLKCSDGSDLLPSDVAKNMQRLADPESGSPFTGRLFGPGGAKSIVGDDDADTLTIEVNQPHADMLESMTNAFVVCPRGLADLEGLGTAPQGSGPYKIASMKRGDEYVLEAWDSPAITDEDAVPPKITMRVVTSDSTRANLFETGATDIAAILGRDNERLVRKHDPIQGKAFGADAISFNERPGRPFADERLRRAVAHAVDPEGFTKAASFGLGEPTRTFITENMNCHTPENGEVTPQFDLDRAKAELKAAGYGPGGKELTIKMLGYDVQNSGPEYLADAIRQLGVKVDITSGTQAQAAGTIYADNDDWDLIVYPYQTAVRTPFPMATKMSSVYGEGGALNWGRVKNAKFEALVKDKLSSVEGDERCALWGQAEAALLERVDFVPLMVPVANYFTDGLTFEAGYRVVNLRSIRNAG
ncbi:ABC transporter substrate-binding protein [Aeromicrobium duanguangcaii]|uniref:ABC transporter substrate-binding protein n=1 Tax=Aeromicrobium duanguangcaii TaxID=2968086 RepID=A0ABY5KHU0_9ACTN|nr:ABC transporter substrate-binding protein [Aeromicrobium duanguangcaii]MCD9153895.1 ABC transporter substrate-binding protein [Aeromicrobium duanguangcaii]UUI69026.1 ABC transporter substrate-binding protein [Aeromicrobium duanguangcaii]